jgi:hypothetical protein
VEGSAVRHSGAPNLSFYNHFLFVILEEDTATTALSPHFSLTSQCAVSIRVRFVWAPAGFLFETSRYGVVAKP